MVVELKDDSEVRGVIESVTPKMDVCLMNATHMLPSGSSSQHESMEVKGGSVRYVHMSPKVRVHSAVSSYMNKLAYINTRGSTKINDDKKKSGDAREDQVIEMPSSIYGSG